ncbi:tripartite tricarboxylate transporter TctB family protein [Oceaniglobus trochenteri]|uniref:tripartite tricarboxylate transporter TctB family protein n=1 Tax=Oceaniglobus trochenteri TaxID=2763260 RepID=UPI001CFF5BE6|nr:tripartite tricarboxylate transporter TctB family protein [Oceaniglobus trochenteri]
MRLNILAEVLAALFLLAICGIVFQQVATSFVEQGIDGGTPYDDAASYPRGVAVVMLGLLAFTLLRALGARRMADRMDPRMLWRPVVLLLIFAGYLVGLTVVGYTIATPPALFVMMKVAGARQNLRTLIIALVTTLVVGLLFQGGLKVVLPRGWINWNLDTLW